MGGPCLLNPFSVTHDRILRWTLSKSLTRSVLEARGESSQRIKLVLQYSAAAVVLNVLEISSPTHRERAILLTDYRLGLRLRSRCFGRCLLPFEREEAA